MAQARPDFSGTWKLNTAKSDIGKDPPPDRITVLKIKHKGSSLRSSYIIDGEDKGEFHIKSDGKEIITKGAERERRDIFRWEGDSLALNRKLLKGNILWLDEKYTYALSEDSRTMIMLRRIYSTIIPQKYRWGRQNGCLKSSKRSNEFS